MQLQKKKKKEDYVFKWIWRDFIVKFKKQSTKQYSVLPFLNKGK